MKQYFTFKQFESGEDIPLNLQGYIADNSDGRMIDDNWNEYVDDHLANYFDCTEEPYEYDVDPRWL